MELLQTALAFRVEPGVLDQDTKLTGDGREELHAIRREVMLFARSETNNAKRHPTDFQRE